MSNLFPTLVLMQAAAAFSQILPAPAFEVASVKPSTSDPGSSGITTERGRISGRNVTLRRCIRGAYNLPENQVLGGPKWVDEERYDIDAKAPGPAGDRDLMIMLQSLLAERFKLILHPETRALSGYALVVDKSGLKATRSQPDAQSRTNSSRGKIDAEACNMTQLALKLSEAIHAPVADLSQVEGTFNFTLNWTPEDLQAKPPSAGDQPMPPGPSIFAALQEQLGLKLVSRKVPTPVLVIDRAEKASGN